jgi:ribonuclease HI
MPSTMENITFTDISMKQYSLLMTYSSLVSDSVESNFSKCAAEYIKISESSNDSFLDDIINRATVFIGDMMHGKKKSGSPSAPSGSQSTTSSPIIENTPSGSFVSVKTSKSRSKRSVMGEDTDRIDDDGVENDSDKIDTDDKNTLYVFCEGTSINIGTNNARSGCGVYAIYKDSSNKSQELRKRYILSNDEQASNQRAELSAFYAALGQIDKLRKEQAHLVTCKIYISSKYAYNCVKDWGDAWASKKWKRSDGPIRNVDIIRPLYEKLKGIPNLEVILYKLNKKKLSTDNIPEGFIAARQLALEVVQLPETATSPITQPTETSSVSNANS